MTNGIVYGISALPSSDKGHLYQLSAIPLVKEIPFVIGTKIGDKGAFHFPETVPNPKTAINKSWQSQFNFQLVRVVRKEKS